MASEKARPRQPLPPAEERRARQAQQAIDGTAAMGEYRAGQEAALDRMAELKALRLAKQTPLQSKNVKKPVKPR
jgi:hypothetical protein